MGGERFHSGKQPPGLRLKLGNGIIRTGKLLHGLNRIEEVHDNEFNLLRSIAAATGGNFYFTDNAHDLPRIFAKETRFAVSPVKLGGNVTVTQGSDSPVVRSLAGKRLPDLSGNVITALRDGAQADLLATAPGSKVDPELAAAR